MIAEQKFKEIYSTSTKPKLDTFFLNQKSGIPLPNLQKFESCCGKKS